MKTQVHQGMLTPSVARTVPATLDLSTVFAHGQMLFGELTLEDGSKVKCHIWGKAGRYKVKKGDIVWTPNDEQKQYTWDFQLKQHLEQIELDAKRPVRNKTMPQIWTEEKVLDWCQPTPLTTDREWNDPNEPRPGVRD